MRRQYTNGQGVERDYAEAFKWYNKAAEDGSAYAQKNVVMSYDVGQGVKQDGAQALKWYTKAAEQGDAEFQYNLGSKATSILKLVIYETAVCEPVR